jgi:hypothetical protein
MLLLFLFGVTLFVSATLLFLIQPMFAKMVLPMLGGTPAVWNTCMVFFQSALLMGYGYAHVATTWLGVRRQAALHVGLLLLPLLTLPISVPLGWNPPVQQNPVPWLLTLLLVSVGLPFFAVSASAPMLQKWFASTGHPAAKDPYFLYGASNLGSLLALLSYPVLLEPNLRLSEQSWMWARGYEVLIVLMLGCAVILWKSPEFRRQNPTLIASHDSRGKLSIGDDADKPTFILRIRWVLLSFVPSSLLLGVTTYLTTELPAIPLLWVIPLAIYLLTFILVFERKPILPHVLMVRVLPFGVLALASLIPLPVAMPPAFFIPLHLLTFFIAAMVCHGELAKSRPTTEHLTEFYLWMSVGGALGGVFNALIAPLIFKSVVEYPLVIVLACLLRPTTLPKKPAGRGRLLDLGLPVALGVFITGLSWAGEAGGIRLDLLFKGLLIVASLTCFAFRDRPVRFGLGVGAMMLATAFSAGGHSQVLHAERSFFGVHRIVQDAEHKYHVLFSGNTIHGAQSLDPSRRREPLLYFFRTGPIGQMFSALSEEGVKPPVAIIGLGTGSMACYGLPGQEFTFYEIDPAVERIARDPRYFTFLQECFPRINVVLGDARLSLKRAPDHHYGLIVLDAFSSDMIPLHLLTREALTLYLAKLVDDGILVFHISNRNLELRPVLSDLARDAGLDYLVQQDSGISEEEIATGKVPSTWAVMSRPHRRLSALAKSSRWTIWAGRPSTRILADDFSNILDLIQWKCAFPFLS